MTAAGELSWPPAGSFLAAHGEVLMAADMPLTRHAVHGEWNYTITPSPSSR